MAHHIYACRPCKGRCVVCNALVNGAFKPPHHDRCDDCNRRGVREKQRQARLEDEEQRKRKSGWSRFFQLSSANED